MSNRRGANSNTDDGAKRVLNDSGESTSKKGRKNEHEDKGGNLNISEGLKRGPTENAESSIKKVSKNEFEDKVVELKIPSVEEMNGNLQDDDDLFGELNQTVNRKIEKCDVLQTNVYYILVDIYIVTVEDRISYVGGFKKEDDEAVIYVWLPASLSRNFTQQKVSQLKSSIDKGKKGYVLYKGKKMGKFGMTYDISWVQKPKM